MRELDDARYESEDVARGASMSLRVTINRVLWREAKGRWSDDQISTTRRELERVIDRLICSKVERHRIRRHDTIKLRFSAGSPPSRGQLRSLRGRSWLGD